MPWSIDIDEFTSEGVSHTLAPDGTATFELTGRYSAHHIVRVPQLPLLELHDAEGGGLDEPVLRAETVSFTMWPNAGDHRRGRWILTARAPVAALPTGARLRPVLTDAMQSLRVPSQRTLAVT